MKRGILFLLLLPVYCFAQNITVFAGGGSSLGDGGPATAALIDNPGGLAFNKAGDLYIATGTGARIRKIDASGIITTIAGNGTSAYSGDGGMATAASLKYPTGVTLDASGNVFIADAQAYLVRRVDHITGIITTICGNGTMGYSGDTGPATAAKLYGPQSLCFDNSGNLYIADGSNHAVRKINPAGIITTFAGTGVQGFNNDGIAATNAQLNYPMDVKSDGSGNIYIADQGNNRIRKVNSSGIISTYAGNGGAIYSGAGAPATNAQFIPTCIVFDANKNLYITGDYRISKIDNSGIFHTIAGNGTKTNTGDGGPAIGATLYSPLGLAIDKCNNLYCSVITYNRIRKVTFNPEPCTYLNLPETVNTQPSIYPNPTTTALHIDNLPTPATYKLLNMVGAAVQHGNLHKGSNSLAIQQLPAGVYMLEVYGEDGERNVSRVIKE